MSLLLNQSSLPKFISAYGLLFYLRRRQMRHLGWGWRCSDSPLAQDSLLTAISTCFFSIIISHFTFRLYQVSEKKSRRPRRIRRLPEASARLGSPAPTEDAHRRVRDGHVPIPCPKRRPLYPRLLNQNVRFCEIPFRVIPEAGVGRCRSVSLSISARTLDSPLKIWVLHPVYLPLHTRQDSFPLRV